MRFDVLTLFPGMFASVIDESMIKRARKSGHVRIELHDLRDWTSDNHRSADDKPFGGGPGMVMKVEPIYRALRDLKVLPGRRNRPKTTRVVLMTPQGKRMVESDARRISRLKRVVIICGHYEGYDERIRQLADEELSIGDYVLTCGEVPAMVLIDAVSRLVPGVLGDSLSLKNESFDNGLLEYPQYTRPAEFKGMKVPEILLSGDHKKIDGWRRHESLKRTQERRPDLLT